MNLFRDPTKYYVLTALGYVFLIPFGASEMYRRLGRLKNVFLLVVVGCLLF